MSLFLIYSIWDVAYVVYGMMGFLWRGSVFWVGFFSQFFCTLNVLLLDKVDIKCKTIWRKD